MWKEVMLYFLDLGRILLDFFRIKYLIWIFYYGFEYDLSVFNCLMKFEIFLFYILDYECWGKVRNKYYIFIFILVFDRVVCERKKINLLIFF